MEFTKTINYWRYKGTIENILLNQVQKTISKIKLLEKKIILISFSSGKGLWRWCNNVSI